MKTLRFLVIGLLAVTVSLLPAIAQSQPPASAPAPVQNQQAQASAKQQINEKKTEATESLAAAVDKLASTIADRNEEDKRRAREDDSFDHWWSVNGTNVFICIFTAALVGVGILQWQIYKETLKSNRRESRAYVSVTPDSMLVINGNIPVVTLRLINFGQTPAKKVSARLDVVTRQEKIGTEFLLPDIKNGWAPEGVVFPNAEQSELIKFMIRQSATTPLAAEEVHDVIAGTKFMYILGEVRYEDVFGGEQFSRCCCGVEATAAALQTWFDGAPSYELALKAAPMGNTAT